jgi:2-polyprenyl-6-hydroxyphenyl methylase/3-demethylubiquinone-9 3-methyltransferase
LKLNDVLELYAGAPPLTRAFLKGRVLLSDLEFIERHVPTQGTIVDIGCGHGLFANLMALRSAERRVVGIDLSPQKIEQARKTIGGRANIDFICTDINSTGIPECDVVTMIDVLYLLSRDQQRRQLSHCRHQLREGGLLVWKAQERRPRWKFAWTYFQELITTSTGLTRGRHGHLAFMSRDESLDALAAAGFTARIVEMKSRRPYTDILYLGS